MHKSLPLRIEMVLREKQVLTRQVWFAGEYIPTKLYVKRNIEQRNVLSNASNASSAIELNLKMLKPVNIIFASFRRCATSMYCKYGNFPMTGFTDILILLKPYFALWLRIFDAEIIFKHMLIRYFDDVI